MPFVRSKVIWALMNLPAAYKFILETVGLKKPLYCFMQTLDSKLKLNINFWFHELLVKFR
jgi:hypothetical protein